MKDDLFLFLKWQFIGDFAGYIHSNLHRFVKRLYVIIINVKVKLEEKHLVCDTIQRCFGIEQFVICNLFTYIAP